jgi:hypothetical protein
MYTSICNYSVLGFHLGSGDTSCNWSKAQVAIEVLTVLQLEGLLSCNRSALKSRNCRVATEALSSCNSSDKNYKNYMSRVATEVLKELQLKYLSCCN